jgi:hypothetical protein
MNGKNRIVLQLSYMDKTIRSLVIGSKYQIGRVGARNERFMRPDFVLEKEKWYS